MALTDHDRRQLAGRWARRWPKAMLPSPYLTHAERAKAWRRVVRRREREAADARAIAFREYMGWEP